MSNEDPPRAFHLRWRNGGEARFLAASGDLVTLDSSVPSPPGSRIEGELTGDAPVAVKVKIHGSRRQADGRFRLEGRPLDLTREVRERIVALVATAKEQTEG